MGLSVLKLGQPRQTGVVSYPGSSQVKERGPSTAVTVQEDALGQGPDTSWGSEYGP